MITGTYTKLRSGDWGVRVEGVHTRYQPGDVISVKKKDGSQRSETVEREIWADESKGLRLLSIRKSKKSSSSNGSGQAPAGQVRCSHCGEWTIKGDDWCMVCGKAGYE